MSKFLSYGKQWLEEDDIAAVVEVLRGDYLTQGPKVDEFEEAICQYTGARYCVSMANGTAALHLAVAALDIEPGSEGITSPNTFVASSNCMIYNGIKPVFADIDLKTYNVDVNEINRKINNRTKLVIPVHFAGQPAEMQEINDTAKKNNLFIIEDAAHAIGSRYEDGSRVGCCKYSDMTIFSFHPVKTITTGEGGAITTNDERIYNKLKLLRSHGITRDKEMMSTIPGAWYYEMRELGFNYRITDFQAALGLSQLKKLDSFIKRRREIVSQYNKAFEGSDFLITPYERDNIYSCFHLYVVLMDFEKLCLSKNDAMSKLKEQGIGTQVHYIPVHTQPYYRKLFNYKWGDYPYAEDYYQKALSIPLYPKMTDDDVCTVIDCIKGLKK